MEQLTPEHLLKRRFINSVLCEIRQQAPVAFRLELTGVVHQHRQVLHLLHQLRIRHSHAEFLRLTIQKQLHHGLLFELIQRIGGFAQLTTLRNHVLRLHQILLLLEFRRRDGLPVNRRQITTAPIRVTGGREHRHESRDEQQ